MCAGQVQRVASTYPLRVLFDSGSDVTLFSVRALPTRVHAKTVEGNKVVGVHGLKFLNQEVTLEDIVFPEFSATKRVPGPVRAKIFNNADSNCDVIIGMDVMQALGINVL